MISTTDVVIVGAGPYGLSLAANLRARGIGFRIFGDSMRFWRDMPIGINLKSFAFATSISIPAKGHSFDEWCRRNGLEDFEPCTMQSFAAYGLDIQERFVPELEQTMVAHVERLPQGFETTLASGEAIRSRRVLVCTGLSGLEHIPEVLKGLGRELMRHTAFISDYSEFRNKRVAVIGGGASAIEAGALVHEAGGTSEVFVRGPEVVFHRRTPRTRPWLERLREPISALGGSRKGWILEHFPSIVHYLPQDRRMRLFRNYLGPASPWWIKDRVVGKFSINLAQEVVGVNARREGVLLAVRDARNAIKNFEVDYVIAGTGYDADIKRVSFLGDILRNSIRNIEGAPRLNPNFESSVPGLHFVGPLSALSFGPLFRFVAGAPFAARRLSHHLAK
jgi:cation diffusion facilitator CzcD-associated flavoprotein CzcO